MAKKGKKRRATIDGLEVSDDEGSPAPQQQRRGPPVAETSGWLRGTVPNDEWQTTRRTWEAVAPHFAKWRGQRVWMPFYYDGACAEHLRALGFANVVHDDQDFFVRVRDKKFMASIDLIWDNPPYTTPDMKERVLRALAASGKPFAMLLPISILHVAFVRDVVDMAHVQTIVPRRAWVKKRGTEDKELPFKYLCWFCFKVKLARDLLFAEDEDGADGD